MTDFETQAADDQVCLESLTWPTARLAEIVELDLYQYAQQPVHEIAGWYMYQYLYVPVPFNKTVIFGFDFPQSPGHCIRPPEFPG